PGAAGREDELALRLVRDGRVRLLDLALQQLDIDVDFDAHRTSAPWTTGIRSVPSAARSAARASEGWSLTPARTPAATARRRTRPAPSAAAGGRGQASEMPQPMPNRTRGSPVSSARRPRKSRAPTTATATAEPISR